MPFLVDGNNLVYAARKFPGMGKMNPEQLCRLLGNWSAARSTNVTIIFDGPAPRLAVLQRMRGMGLSVFFAGRRSADDVLVERLDGDPAPAACTVVSSDHAIQHAARYCRATPVDSEVFFRELVEHPRQDAPQARPEPPEKPETVSNEETDEWLRRFGNDLDEPLDDTELMT